MHVTWQLGRLWGLCMMGLIGARPPRQCPARQQVNVWRHCLAQVVAVRHCQPNNPDDFTIPMQHPSCHLSLSDFDNINENRILKSRKKWRTWPISWLEFVALDIFTKNEWRINKTRLCFFFFCPSLVLFPIFLSAGLAENHVRTCNIYDA